MRRRKENKESVINEEIAKRGKWTNKVNQEHKEGNKEREEENGKGRRETMITGMKQEKEWKCRKIDQGVGKTTITIKIRSKDREMIKKRREMIIKKQ